MITGIKRSLNFFDYQKEFIVDNSRFSAFVGGFGVGKTVAGIGKALYLMQKRRAKGQKATIGILAPHSGLLRDVNILKMEEFLQENKIRYTFNKTSKIMVLPDFKGQIWFRSMHKPETIVGFDASDMILDEFDILPVDKQRIIWTKVIARLRKYEDATLSITSTPEGFRLTYELFVEKKIGKLFQIPTTANFLLPKDYIKSLKQQYEGKLLEQYLKGQFVNLSGLNAYYGFTRKNNVITQEEFKKSKLRPQIHVGMDFNVDPMTAILSRKTFDNKIVIFDELYLPNSNTFQMRDRLVNKYGRDLIICPDMTAKARKTSAKQTDIQILKKAGFQINGIRNSFVSDSLNIVNRELTRQNVLITDNCTRLIKDYEQVTVLKDRSIDKRLESQGLTHISDASRYLIERSTRKQKELRYK